MLKGIILAGGVGTRLQPVTISVNKHLLPVYDRPMIYYPLSILMLSGVRDILLISNSEALPLFQRLLGNGEPFGIRLHYACEPESEGTARAFVIAKSFLGNDRAVLALGDNIFYTHGFQDQLRAAANRTIGATIFACRVNEPKRYGVVQFNAHGAALNIEEKPDHPRSNFAITGLYFFDDRVIRMAAALTRSVRGEFEITDVLREYLHLGSLRVEILDREGLWLDAGTPDSLLRAGLLVKNLEAVRGAKLCCPEEIALRCGYIETVQLEVLARSMADNAYATYLRNLARDTI
jgi:glucose-1-phosphate thymidylyltransferase